MEWLSEDITCLVYFERLVGPLGGGDHNLQTLEILRIADHLEINLPANDIASISSRVFDVASPTFRKGIIGDWRNYFTSEHKQAFKNVAGQLLIDLGYEPNFDW
jgi:hypothetical protein